LCHSPGTSPASPPYDISQCTGDPHKLSRKQRCLVMSDDVNPKFFHSPLDRCYIVLQSANLKHGIELPKEGHHCVFVLDGGRIPFVRGGDQGDLIEVLDGFAGSIEGGEGEDLLYVFGPSSSVGHVDGKGGQDFIISRLATGVKSISGGAGNDFIYVGNGSSVGRVEGNDGSDTIAVAYSTVFALDAGKGSDKIGLYTVAISSLDLGADHSSDLVGYTQGAIYTPPIVYHDSDSDSFCAT